MKKVLFLCVHNSARSQMAEAYLKRFGGDAFEVESAGLMPGALNPFVVRALQEDGIDISGKIPQAVAALYNLGRRFDFVVTVCSAEAAEQCPIFPGRTTRLHWPFPDPASFAGSEDQIMAQVRAVRDQIRDRVREFAARESLVGEGT